MFHFYRQRGFQLKTLGYVTHKSSTLHNIPSLLVCKFRSPFTPNYPEIQESPSSSVVHVVYMCITLGSFHGVQCPSGVVLLVHREGTPARKSGDLGSQSFLHRGGAPPCSSYQTSQSCLLLLKVLVTFMELSSRMVLPNPD